MFSLQAVLREIDNFTTRRVRFSREGSNPYTLLNEVGHRFREEALEAQNYIFHFFQHYCCVLAMTR